MLYCTVNMNRDISMPLWSASWNALCLLRPAFSRMRRFLWFATVVAGLTVRTEH